MSRHKKKTYVGFWRIEFLHIIGTYHDTKSLDISAHWLEPWDFMAMSLESSHGNEGRAWKFTKQIATKALFRGDPVTPSFQALLKVLSQAVPEF